MTRERLSLDGYWDFYFDPDENEFCPKTNSWRTAVVPAPWQSQFDDLRNHSGTAWYRRTFHIPPDWHGSSVLLHFGAVDYHAQVWINDILLGSHEGGYLPFEFNIARYIRPGKDNKLLVRVTDPTDNPQKYPHFPFSEIPYGKQSWYGPMSGIWQSVWIERRSPLHIMATRLIPNLNTGQVSVSLLLSTPACKNLRIQAQVLDYNANVMASCNLPVAIGTTTIEFAIAVDNPWPWSPDSPYLYRLELCVVEAKNILDQTSLQFGFRTIEARNGKLFLNGDLLYLRGTLDQDYYPDTMYTLPSEDFLIDQIRKAKELGLNCLRCHIKIADPRYYEVADRLGMLVWAELPSWRLLTEKAAQRALATLQGLVERDGNHPSIIAWTIVNEGWGLDLVNNADHRAWLQQAYQWLKALDPSRLVVDNSPCCPNFHIQTDIVDYHEYRVSSFAWLRRSGPFARWPGGPLLDLSFQRVIPEHILLGFAPSDFEAHVFSGLFVGWVHKPVALIAVRPYGKGYIVMTTFRLTRDTPHADPIATNLLDGLIELCATWPQVRTPHPPPCPA